MIQLILQRKFPLLLSLLFLLSACSHVRLISEYDEITDKTVTALQEKVAEFFIELESDIEKGEAEYKDYKDFYRDAKVDLRTLKIRADAIDKNRIVQEQVAELTKMVDNLETLHKIGFSSVEQIKPFEQPFDAAFTAIIKLQLALKRGEKTK